MVLDYVAKEGAGMQFIMHPMLLFCSTAYVKGTGLLTPLNKSTNSPLLMYQLYCRFLVCDWHVSSLER